MLAERTGDGLVTIRTPQLPRREERATAGQKLRVALRALVTNVTGRRAENPPRRPGQAMKGHRVTTKLEAEVAAAKAAMRSLLVEGSVATATGVGQSGVWTGYFHRGLCFTMTFAGYN